MLTGESFLDIIGKYQHFTMVVFVAATPMDASAVTLDHHMITDTTITPADEPSSISNPIELFGVDYNNCNGILSAMIPSISVVAPSSFSQIWITPGLGNGFNYKRRRENILSSFNLSSSDGNMN